MSRAGAFPGLSAGLWRSLWILLRMRLVLTWSSYRRAKLRQKIAQAIFLLFLTAIATGGFLFSRMLIQVLRSPALASNIDLTGLFSNLPGLMLALAFFFNLLTNFGILLQALYLSRDMDFLIAAPLPMRAVFLSKLILAILPGFGLFSLGALPLLFGLGAASGFHPLYYPLVVISLGVIALASAGTASILVMAVVRVIPPRRVAEVLGFIGAIISILISQSGNLMGTAGIGGDQLAATVSRLSGLMPVWSPFTWAGRGLVDLGRGDWLSGASLTLATLLAAGVLFAVTLKAAEQLYYSGWAGLQSSSQKAKSRPNRKSAEERERFFGTLLPLPVVSIIARDALLLRRDLRNLSQLITPLIFGLVMVLSSGRAADAGQGLPGFPVRSLPTYTSILFTLFVGWMLLFNLATTSISREGKSFWLLGAAPLRPLHLLSAKYIFAIIPTLLISWLFAAITALLRSMSFSDLAYVLLVTGFCVAGLNSILLTFGVVGANLDAEDPRKMGLRGGAGCLSMLVSLVYCAVGLLLFLAPPVLFELFQKGSLWLGRSIGLIPGILFSLLCAILPPLALRQRVALIGQPKD